MASDDNDVVFGGSGDDTIIGGAGADLMFGGSGRDTFVISDSLDTIGDFNVSAFMTSTAGRNTCSTTGSSLNSTTTISKTSSLRLRFLRHFS